MLTDRQLVIQRFWNDNLGSSNTAGVFKPLLDSDASCPHTSAHHRSFQSVLKDQTNRYEHYTISSVLLW